MPSPPLSVRSVAAVALREAFTHASYWGPALLLLTPTLLLQLAAPTYLRTRLAPSPWTVAAGAVLLVWFAQVVLPAVSALVHARRTGVPRTLDVSLMRLSVAIGTLVTVGLAAAVVPGLWLQARHAFAPLTLAQSDPTGARGRGAASGEILDVRSRLWLVGCGALVASMLGQSTVAAAAEAMDTITAAGEMNGRTVFQLHFLPHAITTVAAYVWSTATLVVQALCVSVLFDAAHGVMPADTQPRQARMSKGWLRAGRIAAAAAALGALVATIYKVEQHFH